MMLIDAMRGRIGTIDVPSGERCRLSRASILLALGIFSITSSALIVTYWVAERTLFRSVQQRLLDPDIILMDLRMPKVDGFETTRRIREQAGNTVRPWIVAVTANIRDCDRAEALASGMNDFIGKPIRVESLQAALSRAHAAVLAP
jgi:CheY-like chemotaxis protein